MQTNTIQQKKYYLESCIIYKILNNEQDMDTYETWKQISSILNYSNEKALQATTLNYLKIHQDP